MTSSNARLWATSAGVVAAFVTAAAMIATVGVGLGFVAVWTCVPEHSANPDATGCSLAEARLRLAVVLALCLTPAWPAFVFTRKWALRRMPAR